MWDTLAGFGLYAGDLLAVGGAAGAFTALATILVQIVWQERKLSINGPLLLFSLLFLLANIAILVSLVAAGGWEPIAIGRLLGLSLTTLSWLLLASFAMILVSMAAYLLLRDGDQ